MCSKLQKYLPGRVCFCCPYNVGIQVLIVLIILLRLAGMVCGGFYGPYLYLVISLGGIYLSADILILYSVFWKGEKTEDCEYPNQRIWLSIWQVMNILAIFGLLVAIGWYIHLGTWAMLHVPVHFVTFIIILVLIVLLIYTAVVVFSLGLFLREQYIDSVLGKQEDEDIIGLTDGGRRVSV